ncbi:MULTISPECIES: disulfide bond formation protein B [Alphaproteobacteria]|uniref:Disulfide bond formation protein B n=2 Tax=Alphaproteobacteria TaxID=28211 RepID=A0A512HLL6_9HYPH|nr:MULTISPECIES: disulfide bond formation protein B [Alphaproteobacteria]GEO86338.1 disulfide bond formation protein B [Ciceribacter naphthalenivorans]GLR21820.1 disulfide bond formation protein B [Ciceribacter naphthalenivorans]GLT04676.1 disulfide bond formation protein B [Sphingomonas psychrolutea]
MNLPDALLKSDTTVAAVLTLGMAVVVGSALGFEHIGGYIPCALCLLQRNPYYIGVGVGALAVLSSLFKLPPIVTRGLIAVIAVLMIVSIGLGTYHAGVEWKFWEGPASCTIGATSAEAPVNVLEALNSTKAPSCTDATLRVLGLSFAGWNVLTSAALAAIALWATFRKRPA